MDLRRVDHVDKHNLQILQDDPPTTYDSLEDLADALPENTPRYVLLSYPMTTVLPPSTTLAKFRAHCSS